MKFEIAFPFGFVSRQGRGQSKCAKEQWTLSKVGALPGAANHMVHSFVCFSMPVMTGTNHLIYLFFLALPQLSDSCGCGLTLLAPGTDRIPFEFRYPGSGFCNSYLFFAFIALTDICPLQFIFGRYSFHITIQLGLYFLSANAG